MGQRFTLDRQSFEQFLAAASFLQQVQRQAARNGVRDFQFAKPLLELVETQHAIESGSLSLETAISRIVGLSMKVVGASGAAAWLFTQNEFVFCAGAGSTARDDDRLRLEVLGKLAGSCQLQSDPPLALSSTVSRDGDEGCYPGSMKSILVAPIYQGRDIAGALAACSPEMEAFQDRDGTNLRLLAGLIAHALGKTAAAGLKQTMALERVAMLKVIHRIMPTLQQLVEERVQSRSIAHHNSIAAHGPVVSSISDEGDDEVSEDEFRDESGSPAAVLNACQKTFDQLPIEPIEESSSESKTPANDISVPFVGVRAALGGDVVEESHVWASILGVLAWPGKRIASGVANFYRGLAWELEGLREALSRAGARTRHAISYRPSLPRVSFPRPKLPNLPRVRFQERVLQVRAAVSDSGTQVVTRLRSLVSSLPELPVRPSLSIPRPKLRHRLLAVRIAAVTGVNLALVRLRAALRQIPDLPSLTITLPPLRTRQVFGRYLARIRSSSLRVAEQARAELAFVLRHRPHSRSLRRAAPAGAILLVMVAFLISEAGLYHPSQTAVASGRAVNAASLVVPAAQPSLKIPVVAHPAAALTHRQITDPTVMGEVQELSRYEIAGIQRLAYSGDDYYEFELGMLYETGHGLTQNCTKAAEWVAKAAEQGNPAAEYNLGLRYREGDGVGLNQAEAERWLQKAAAHKYSHPKLA